MNNELRKTIKEMKQLAAKEPFEFSAYNPTADPKLSRVVIIDDEFVTLLFTLDLYPMMPDKMWHLTVAGKVNPIRLKQLVTEFFSTGDVMEVPQEELIKLGMRPEQITNQRQFCQIAS